MRAGPVETCCVVEDDFCESPANLEEPVAIRTTCYACGLKVCKNCSAIGRYFNVMPENRKGRHRLCFNCLRDLRGDEHVRRIVEARDRRLAKA